MHDIIYRAELVFLTEVCFYRCVEDGNVKSKEHPVSGGKTGEGSEANPIFFSCDVNKHNAVRRSELNGAGSFRLTPRQDCLEQTAAIHLYGHSQSSMEHTKPSKRKVVRPAKCGG